MIRARVTPALLFACGVFAVYLILTLVHAATAHADPATPALVAVQAAATDPLAVIGVVLGGLALLLTGAERILGVIAPRTKNTLDDAVLADIREALAFIRGLPGAPPLPAVQAPASPVTVNVAGPVAMLAVLLLGAVALPACGAGQRETTIKAALVTVDAARDSFVAYDSAEQTNIISKATSLDDGKTKLSAYRNSRVKTVEAFTIAYRAIAAAATLNDDPSVAGLKAALAQLLSAVTTVTGGTP